MGKTKLRVVEPQEAATRYTGTLTVLQRINQYEFAVEIRMMREGLNRNKWDYRNLAENYETFIGRPILCAFLPNGKIGDGHNMREKLNHKTGETYYSFTESTSERIVGSLSDNKDDFTIKEIDGEKWLIAKGRLWEFYAPELVEKIIRTGRMDVSVETMVEDSHEEGDIEVFTRWVGLGVTILGDDVQPAIPNASIKALELLMNDFTEAKLKAASFEKQKEASITNEKARNKGERNTMTVLNQKERSNLQKTYFADYKVLAARHDAENSETLVCLMAADGSTYLYILGDAENTVQPERIKQISVNARVDFDSERSVDIDVSAMIDSVMDGVSTLSRKLETAEKRADDAESRVATMESAEKARRIKAAKDVAKRTLDAFNETAETPVDEAVLVKINEAIESGAYSDCEDANGEWRGDEEVEKCVYAECGVAVKKQNEMKAAQEKTVFGWNKMRDNRKTGSTVSDFLARKGIRKDD